MTITLRCGGACRNVVTKRLAALRAPSLFSVPSCWTIGAGMKGMPARLSGWISAAPRICGEEGIVPWLGCFSTHDAQCIALEEQYPVPSLAHRAWPSTHPISASTLHVGARETQLARPGAGSRASPERGAHASTYHRGPGQGRTRAANCPRSALCPRRVTRALCGQTWRRRASGRHATGGWPHLCGAPACGTRRREPSATGHRRPDVFALWEPRCPSQPPAKNGVIDVTRAPFGHGGLRKHQGESSMHTSTAYRNSPASLAGGSVA